MVAYIPKISGITMVDNLSFKYIAYIYCIIGRCIIKYMNIDTIFRLAYYRKYRLRKILRAIVGRNTNCDLQVVLFNRYYSYMVFNEKTHIQYFTFNVFEGARTYQMSSGVEANVGTAPSQRINILTFFA